MGTSVGDTVGALLGEAEGDGVGYERRYVGVDVGSTVGALVGSALGCGVGRKAL